MKTIWKFPLQVTHTQVIKVPAGANLLSIQSQLGEMMLWAEVDPTKPKEKRTLTMYGTGHEMPDAPGIYIDTVQEGPYVWHFYQPWEENPALVAMMVTLKAARRGA